MSDNNISSINIITEGTTIKGDINAAGDVRMDGILDGNITIAGKLVVGEKGSIMGNVVCQNANIMGHITGNVSVKDFLSMYATAYIKGDIVSNKLCIEPGAYFSGTCHMMDELTEAK